MAEELLIPIYKSSDIGRAEVIRIALEESGIRCALENELQAGLSGILQCRLLVLSSDFEAAREIIDECENSHKNHEPAHS
ncbi:putative signal transducing protein [Planctomicrobium sp. SH527]|uniref:putative signal transducing protein n=1 Tax=Planctomicrobium sp. SH527 TaxID=3448123 RepID=UPI003F5C2425